MFCINCGSTLPDNALFCSKCGAQQLREDSSRIQEFSEGQQGAFSSVTVNESEVQHIGPNTRLTDNASSAREQSEAVPKVLAAIGGIVFLVMTAAIILLVFLNLPGNFISKDSPLNAPNTPEEPVYVLTKSTQYGDTSTSITRNEFDEAGNLFRQSVRRNDVGYVVDFSYDEQGYTESCTRTTNGATHEEYFTARNEFDLEGNWVEETYENRETGEQWLSYFFSYYDNGRMKHRETHSKGLADGHLETDVVQDREYDERGYCLRSTQTNTIVENNSTSVFWNRYEWRFDEHGNPLSYSKTDQDGHSESFTVETDSAGNICTIRNDDGVIVAEYEYERIENPTEYVRRQWVKSIIY